MPRHKNPIPQSQKNIVRQVARKAWRDAACELDSATVIFDNQLRREIGASWLAEGQELGHELFDYWAAHGIAEPQSVYCRGEPGVLDEWDES
jgi:hypothetical protein